RNPKRQAIAANQESDIATESTYPLATHTATEGATCNDVAIVGKATLMTDPSNTTMTVAIIRAIIAAARWGPGSPSSPGSSKNNFIHSPFTVDLDEANVILQAIWRKTHQSH